MRGTANEPCQTQSPSIDSHGDAAPPVCRMLRSVSGRGSSVGSRAHDAPAETSQSSHAARGSCAARRGMWRGRNADLGACTGPVGLLPEARVRTDVGTRIFAPARTLHARSGFLALGRPGQ